MKRLGTAIACGACFAALGYALSRLVQVAFFPEPDPRAVLTVLRIGFFWRAAIAGYVGLIAAIGAYALQVRVGAAIDRFLPRLVLATALIGSLQGIFVP
jgi:hypothetical protein